MDFLNFSLSKFSFFFFYFFTNMLLQSHPDCFAPPPPSSPQPPWEQQTSEKVFTGITMGRGPIWGIHSLSPFILSWYSLLVEMSVSEQKRRGPFHASVSISQEANGWKLRFLRVAYQLNNHQKKLVAKSCRITCHKLNSIIVIKIIAIWVFKNTKSVYLRGYKSANFFLFVFIIINQGSPSGFYCRAEPIFMQM